MMALLTTPGFQLNEAARLDGKKTEKGRESSGLARKTKKKEGDFFWRVTETGKGGTSSWGEKLVGGEFFTSFSAYWFATQIQTLNLGLKTFSSKVEAYLLQQLEVATSWT
eukprot:XP_019079216.1 PREDICTED: uncharacterized protein LOC109123554 [Vitis vinifera]